MNLTDVRFNNKLYKWFELKHAIQHYNTLYNRTKTIFDKILG